MIGLQIAHYLIESQIGQGGMGDVYLARDIKLQRQVALKFLPDIYLRDSELKARFIREARSISSFDHPNICTIHEIRESDDHKLFMVMPYYKGITLRQKISQGALNCDEITDIGTQIARGLAVAHKAGIVHRDLKPENIFITHEGIVKILDFGLAKNPAYQSQVDVNLTMGTVAYMSPEQTRGDCVDHRCDLWALGVMLYEMASGQLPFRGDYQQAIIYSILNELPESLPENIDPELTLLEPVWRCLLSKDVTCRPDSAQKVIESLTSFSDKSCPVRIWWKRPLIQAAAGFLLLAVPAIILLKFINPANQGRPLTLAVLGFENQTGETNYNYLSSALPNMLTSHLNETGAVKVVTWQKMADLSKRIGLNGVNFIDEEVGYALTDLAGIDLFVVGSFVKAGNRFAMTVNIIDSETKELLNAAQSGGEGIGSFLDQQLETMSVQILQGVGAKLPENRSSLRIDVTCQSLEAYSCYLEGHHYMGKFETARALPQYARAVALDSTFATAHYLKAVCEHYTGAYDEMKKSLAAAMRHRRICSDAERLRIEAWNAYLLKQDFPTFKTLYDKVISLRPTETIAMWQLGTQLLAEGMYKESLRYFLRAFRVDSGFGPALSSLGYNYNRLGKIDSALFYLRLYTETDPYNANRWDSLGDAFLTNGLIDSAAIYYAKVGELNPRFPGNYKPSIIDALREQYDSAFDKINRYITSAETPNHRASGYNLLTIYPFMLGRSSEAYHMLAMRDSILESIPGKWMFGISEKIQGYMALRLGEYEKSRQLLLKSVEPSTEDDDARIDYLSFLKMYYEIIVDSEVNAAAASERLKQLMNKPRDGLKSHQQQNIENLIWWARAKVNLATGDYDAASTAFDTVRTRFKLINVWSSDVLLFNSYNMTDVKAQALLKKGDLQGACEEYELLTKFDPLLPIRLVDPLHHLALGKIYEELNLTAEAAAQYSIFLQLAENSPDYATQFSEASRRLQSLAASE